MGVRLPSPVWVMVIESPKWTFDWDWVSNYPHWHTAREMKGSPKYRRSFAQVPSNFFNGHSEFEKKIVEEN